MRLTTFAGAGLSCLLFPVAALAQARPSADLFLLQNESLSGSSPLYGGGFSTGGIIGLRVSGAAGLNTVIDEYGEEGYGLATYSADADIVLSVAALGGTSRSRAGAVPYAFAGLGLIGRRTGDSYDVDVRSGEWERGPSASVGGGMSLPLGDVLALDGSARYRIPFADSTQWLSGFPRGWEYRVGLRLNLGGAARDNYPSRREPARRTSRGSSRSGSSRPRGPSAIEQMGTILSIPTSGAASATAMRVVNTAEDYLGVPYVWGGNTPSGFDCSGFTKYVFAKHGIELPRVSRQQAQVGERVSTSLSSLRVGDLLFFAADYSRVDHVAIYVGNDRIIHATASGGEVRYDDLRSQRGAWFLDHMVGARRVTGDSQGWESTLQTLLGQLVKEYDRGDKAPRP